MTYSRTFNVSVSTTDIEKFDEVEKELIEYINNLIEEDDRVIHGHVYNPYIGIDYD